MPLPEYGPTQRSGDKGVWTVEGLVQDAGHLWRRVEHVDLGIDGHIELLMESAGKRFGTGRIALVQVKSGQSYFRQEAADHWLFIPEEKHAAYWTMANLDVHLALVDANGRVFMENATRALNTDPTGPIAVPKEPVTPADLASRVFGGDVSYAADPNETLRRLEAESQTQSWRLGGIRMFAMGLVDEGDSLYVGADIYPRVHQLGPSQVAAQQEAVRAYVGALVKYGIIRPSSYLSWMEELRGRKGFDPHFVAPLTTIGRRAAEVVRTAAKNELMFSYPGSASVTLHRGNRDYREEHIDDLVDTLRSELGTENA